MTQPARAVVFLDTALLATGVRLPPSAARVGVLGNLPAGEGADAVRVTLVTLGLSGVVDAALVVVASGLGCPLPDPRAFAAAAAVAGVTAAECAFVSADLTALVAAGVAGFLPITAPPAAAAPAPAAAVGSGGALLAGEVDPDSGPTYILRGHVVTMRQVGEHIPNGRVLVSKGLIRGVLKPNDPLPAAFAAAPEVDTAGTIYPGLLDLHNHFVYNVLPLWVVPKAFKNRSQWPREGEYKANVSKPIKQALAPFTHSAAAVIRYVEAKALIGGATTGQGIRTQTKVGNKATRGSMRNVEETKDPRLPAAGSQVPDLGTAEDRIEALRASLGKRTAFFYHLSEGIDNSARKHFENLAANELLAPSLVGIHSLALTRADLDAMAAAGAKIVWSPFSNMLLYTKTLKLADVKASGVQFCLGCDWSPTGSRNLLQELKVAEFENARQGDVFTPFELVRAVTAAAAEVVGWEAHLGQIRTGMMADLLVVAGTNADPYAHLIRATEPAVRLVTVHGVARYGDRALVEQIHAGDADDLEDVTIAGKPKVFFLQSDEPLLNKLTYTAAVERLKVAMADLPAFVERMKAEGDSLLAMGMPTAQELTLELDNEFHDDPLTEFADDEAALAAAGDTPMAESIDLDGPAVAGDAEYMSLVAQQTNIPAALIAHMKTRYGL